MHIQKKSAKLSATLKINKFHTKKKNWNGNATERRDRREIENGAERRDSRDNVNGPGRKERSDNGSRDERNLNAPSSNRWYSSSQGDIGYTSSVENQSNERPRYPERGSDEWYYRNHGQGSYYSHEEGRRYFFRKPGSRVMCHYCGSYACHHYAGHDWYAAAQREKKKRQQ